MDIYKERRDKEIRDKEKRHEKFVRWQGRTITQLSYSVNLILTLSVAALGFGASPLLNGKFESWSLALLLYACAMFALLISVWLGICCTITRLNDFRKTKDITNLRLKQGTTRELPNTTELLNNLPNETKILGERTWRLFWWQIRTFGFGVLLLVFSVGLHFVYP